MDIVAQLLDLFLHLDAHLTESAGVLGPWLYALLFLIVFCETGLVVTPFLPGDSLLFAAGPSARSTARPSISALALLLVVAAVAGDALNYSIGSYVGPAVFTSERSWLLNKQHLLRTQLFYARHGGKTIFLARFVPIVRTFAPFVAGIGRMPYRYFASWNVTARSPGWWPSCSAALVRPDPDREAQLPHRDRCDRPHFGAADRNRTCARRRPEAVALSRPRHQFHPVPLFYNVISSS